MAKLTKSLVEQAKPQDKDYFLWDDEIKGFGCRILKGGKKTYVFFCYSPTTKKKTNIKIGCHGNITIDFARKKALELSLLVASGIDPRDQKKEQKAKAEKDEKEGILFQEFVEIFKEKHMNVYYKPSTLKICSYLFKNQILPFFTNKKLNSITKQDIFAFQNVHLQHKTTCNRCLDTIRIIFTKAILWGFRTDGINPCAGVSKYKENKKERFLTEEELEALKEKLNSYQSLRPEGPYVLGAIQLINYTGCRKSEILTLKWEDVQLDQDCIHLKDSKNGKQKIVPLHSLSKAVLEQMKPRTNNPYVFCGRKPGAHLTDPKKTWSKIRKELGLEDVRMHDLRHTFASMSIKAGLGLYQVAKLLGHSNVQTTMRYAHIEREELVKNANIVEALYA
jgi:integrase